jgi:putative flippase GtrA
MEAKREARAVVRYGTAGGTGVAVGLLAGYLLHLGGAAYLEASSEGYLLGFCANYFVARFVVKVVKV